MSSIQRERGGPSSISSDDDLIDIQHTGTTNSDALYGVDSETIGNGGNANKNTGLIFGEEIAGLGQYDDFHTIDWQRDIARDRMRHRHIVQKKKESICDMIRGAHDAWSGWLCVLLVGILSGMVAGIVDIGATWLQDIKLGVCPSAFYLNKEQCCWSSEEVEVDLSGNCSLWLSWPEVFGKEKLGAGAGPYAISYFSYVAIAVMFAALAASLVRMFAPYACGSGIPEIKTILSGFIIRGYLGKWTFLIKAVAIMLAVAAGLSLGKEGPMVHMACCTGNILAYLFPKYGKNEAKKREVLSAASAAGVAIAFGAPIGGVMFSLEEVSYYFPLKTLWRSFFCALVAAFVLQSINPFGNDHSVLFYVEYNTPWMFFELIPFLILGVIGGLVGAAFIRANIAWCKFRKSSRLGHYPVVEVLLVALATGLLAFPNPYTRMNASDLIYVLYSKCEMINNDGICGYEAIYYNIDENLPKDPIESKIFASMWQLILAFAFKLIATIITFGIKVPSGLFVPSLCMGAIIGRIVGIGMENLLHTYKDIPMFTENHCAINSCITPGLYAMVGSAAVLGGVTRMTVSLVVIMFEVTGGVRYIVPLMTACMTAKWVGDALGRNGIYDAHISLNGYPFLDIKEEFDHTTLAKEVMQPQCSRQLHVLTQGSSTLNEVTSLIENSHYNGFPVVASKESKVLVGYVATRDLKLSIQRSRTANESINGNSILFFTNPVSILDSKIDQPQPLLLGDIVDFSPNCITAKCPMELVINSFRKLGLRQTLVTENGRIEGIITKKDILEHIKKMNYQ